MIKEITTWKKNKKHQEGHLPLNRNSRSFKTSSAMLLLKKGCKNTRLLIPLSEMEKHLMIGVRASLRNTKPLKSPDLKRLEDVLSPF